MKYSILFFVFFIFSKSQEGFCQQNYFNVPSFEITKKKHFFFQEQINFADTIQANSTFDWGIGHGMELGFNIYGIEFHNPLSRNVLVDDTTSKYDHLDLMNIQKLIPLNRNYAIGMGLQAGIRNTGFKSSSSAGMAYGAFAFYLPKRLSYTIGPWIADSRYLKSPTAAGIQAGVEWHIIHEKISFVADSISGNTPISVTAIGFAWTAVKQWIISSAWQNPNAGVGGQAIVVELTFREEKHTPRGADPEDLK